MGLIIRSSRIHQAGCYTTAPIPKHTRIIEYTGERIPNEEADRRYADREHTYLFGLADGKTVVDGSGMAAFINHSCAPNCEAEEIEGRVWITSLRDIAPGEELTYDYNLYDGSGDAPCRCGAPKCRGTMYAPGKIRKRKKGRQRERGRKTRRGAQARSKRQSKRKAA